MTINAESLGTFQDLLEDAIGTFAHEHGPFMRQLLGVAGDHDIYSNVVLSFFGHTLEVLVRNVGRQKVEQLIAEILSRIELLDATVEAVAKTGQTIDPRVIAAELVQQKSQSS